MSRAPSAVGAPARRQRTLLGFLKMSSLDAALSDYDNEFSTLQIQSGRLDGKRPDEGGAEGRD